jgi:hypothetical protein
MTYFGYPLDIHGWKTRPETEPNKFRSSKPENRGRKIQTKPKPAIPETREYPTRNRPIAILRGVRRDTGVLGRAELARTGR